MTSKIGLDQALVEKARTSARKVAEDTQRFIHRHTTVAVERTVCRLLGIDGVNEVEVPMPNVVVEHLTEKELLSDGAALRIGNAMAELGIGPQEVAEGIDKGGIDLAAIPMYREEEIREALAPVVQATMARIDANVARRREYLTNFGDKQGPYIYLIVATGNIYEDIIQAKAAAGQGADVIAVIRTTGQSLLDFVPFGATTEGFGGTYATQENFRLMRAALDGPLHAGDRRHGSPGAAGCDAKRRPLRHFVPGYQYAAHHCGPVFLPGDQRLRRGDYQHRRGQLSHHRRCL